MHYKFGISSDIRTRNIAHIKTFNDFKIIYIKECNHNNYAEILFKSDLRDRNLLTTYKDNTEIFITSDEYNITDITSMLDNIIRTYEYNSQIIQLQLKQIELQIEQERTKQLELQLRLKQS